MAKGQLEYLQTVSGLSKGSLSDHMNAAFIAAGGELAFYRAFNGANKLSLSDNARLYYATKTGKTGSVADLQAYYWANPN